MCYQHSPSRSGHRGVNGNPLLPVLTHIGLDSPTARGERRHCRCRQRIDRWIYSLRRDDHARNALLAARDIQRNWRERRDSLAAALGLSASELGIGIGIHAGELSFGEFGRSHRDLTAIGTVVNTASRAQSVAEPDQILVTQSVYQRARTEMPDSQPKAYQLKGFDAPIELYAA